MTGRRGSYRDSPRPINGAHCGTASKRPVGYNVRQRKPATVREEHVRIVAAMRPEVREWKFAPLNDKQRSDALYS